MESNAIVGRIGSNALDVEVANVLRHRIGTGYYPPNTPLPSEQHLADEFHTSRRTTSSALGQLSKEGLVKQVRRRGTRVLSPAEWFRSRTVGVVYPSGLLFGKGLGSEVGPMIEGAEKALSDLGYPFRRLLRSDLPPWKEIPDQFGAVLFIEVSSNVLPNVISLERELPLVVANLEIDLAVPATRVDHAKVIRTAVRLLAALGHRRIAYVGTEPALYFYATTHRAFLETMSSLHLDVEPEWVCLCANSMPLDAYIVARRLLSMPRPPTAIVAARDTHAEGVCRVVEEAGLSLGHDVSVIGFDDLSWEEGRSVLTTFREPTRDMGAAAARMLADRIVAGRQPPQWQELDAPLIVRSSVGPPLHRATGDPSSTPELILMLADEKSPPTIKAVPASAPPIP